MIGKIIDLAKKLYSSDYVALLSEDLKSYSPNELKTAYDELVQESKEKRLSDNNRSWLIANTTY